MQRVVSTFVVSTCGISHGRIKGSWVWPPSRDAGYMFRESLYTFMARPKGTLFLVPRTSLKNEEFAIPPENLPHH